MAHKRSTELLLSSDTSLEEIYVPPLDLGRSVENDIRINPTKSTTILIVDPADIHHMPENAGPIPAPRKNPVPAERKSFQPQQLLQHVENHTPQKDNAIESKLSPINEAKESVGQVSELHKNLHRHLQNISTAVSENTKKPKKSHINKIKKVDKATRKALNTNLTEIKSAQKEKRMKIKKKLFGGQSVDETTSFIIENENIENKSPSMENLPDVEAMDKEESKTQKKNYSKERRSEHKSTNKGKKNIRKLDEKEQVIQTVSDEKEKTLSYDYKKMIGKNFLLSDSIKPFFISLLKF